MKQITLILITSLLASANAFGALVLNPGFERSATADWDVVTSGAGAPNKTGVHRVAGLNYYLSGDYSELGKKRLLLNTTPGRSHIYTAQVYEDNKVTPQRATAATWTFIAALGQRIDEGNPSFDDTSSVDLRIGYLAVDGDISSFVLIEEGIFPVTEIAKIGKGNYQDFFVSTTILKSAPAYGKQLAIQLVAYSPEEGFGGQKELQASVDHIRVESAGEYVSIPEPSSTTALLGLLALGCALQRRQRL
ncbi:MULTISPECIES: hypothetical protein [unclassified Lentimonas]|uniref:hypothetical protein n=1 Tax=unclassified Lentimonas TaxID=2630993 RepID=UPI001320BC72|nr:MULTISPECIES: hypothetical protein [unclassified Lentimonas]CAA6691849.1 Unannotated [Lentimonas sp. CC10]CAA6692098.1 Unannotated [Lentimonas sp. CC19]CAA7070649.1 Unannotated [Lentimonas sp. CC11]